MTSRISKEIAYEYDPTILGGTSSHSTKLFESWIDELIYLNDNASANQTEAISTENVVQVIKRYDTLFRELLKQSSIYSDSITRLLARTWNSSVKLLDFMIKNYHLYVRNTTHIQEQAQKMLEDRKSEVVREKFRKEDHVLKKTILNGQIRDLEARLESLGVTERELARENTRLKETINAFIKAKELNEPLWEVMNQDYLQNVGQDVPETHHHHHHDEDEDEEIIHEQKQNFKKDVLIEKQNLYKMDFQTLSRLEIEMSEILAQVMAEQDEQKTLLKKYMLLMKNNPHVFGDGLMVNGYWRTDVSTNVDQNDQEVQVDEIDALGVIEDEILTPRDDLPGNPPAAPAILEIKGASIPWQLRKLMKTFPKVLRISSLEWVKQTILEIYFEKIKYDIESAKTSYKKMPLGPFVHYFFKQKYSMDCIADAQCALIVNACETYMLKEPRIALFASQLGVYEKESFPNLDVRDTEFILSAISSLLAQGELPVPTKKLKHARPEDFYIQPDILRSAAVYTVSQLFHAWLPDHGDEYIRKVMNMSNGKRGQRFVDLDAFLDIILEPWHNVRSTWEDHAIYLFRENCSVHRVMAETQFANDIGARERDAMLMEVNKKASEDCIRRPVRNILKPNRAAEESSNQIENKFNHGRGRGNPNKEPVVELVTKKIFTEVIHFINPDVTIDEIHGVYAEACILEKEICLRALEQLWVRYSTAILGHRKRKEWNDSIIASIVKNMKKKDKKEPPKYIEDRFFYINVYTNATQWVKPYHRRTFLCNDIQVYAFVTTLMQHNFFPKSPLVEMLHVNPKDLWPNVDMFLKQIMEQRLQKLIELGAEGDAETEAKRKAEDDARLQKELEDLLARQELERSNAKHKGKKQRRKSSIIHHE